MNAHQENTERPDAATAPYARVVIAKPGLDEHRHSTHGIAHALRDEGFEVTCADLGQASAQVVAAVITEDAPTPQPAVPSGAHLTMVNAVIKRLKQEAAGAVPGLAGGLVPAAGIPALHNVSANVMREWAC